MTPARLSAFAMWWMTSSVVPSGSSMPHGWHWVAVAGRSAPVEGDGRLNSRCCRNLSTRTAPPRAAEAYALTVRVLLSTLWLPWKQKSPIRVCMNEMSSSLMVSALAEGGRETLSAIGSSARLVGRSAARSACSLAAPLRRRCSRARVKRVVGRSLGLMWLEAGERSWAQARWRRRPWLPAVVGWAVGSAPEFGWAWGGQVAFGGG